MEIPQKTKVVETELSTMWFDEHGIFCTVSKKDVPITKERLTNTFEFIRKHAGTDKICWLGDVTNASFPTDEARDFAGEETPGLIKALALITNSKISKLIANVFLTLKKPPYPVKLFTDESVAREWLVNYL